MNLSARHLAALLVVCASTVHAADPPISLDERTRDQIERQIQKAQEQLERSAQQIADLSTRLSGAAWSQVEPWVEMGHGRAMLGVTVGSSKPDGSGSVAGARIVSVSPGGPAEMAGLKANDVIVSVAGKELRSDPKTSAEYQLLAAMHDAKADTPIAVEYRRDGKVLKVDVIPKSMDEYITEYVDRSMKSVPREDDEEDGDEEPEQHVFRYGRHQPSGYGSIELTELSPGLGHYFGTEKGLLVVRAPQDDRLKLQDGDVILDIDGRAPNGVSHAYQILSSYRAGETVKLHVMRQQKKLELSVEIPPKRAHSERSAFTPLPAAPIAPLPPLPVLPNTKDL